eukprot:14412497-Ditylum_brightwellii.AAC.1
MLKTWMCMQKKKNPERIVNKMRMSCMIYPWNMSSMNKMMMKAIAKMKMKKMIKQKQRVRKMKRNQKCGIT